MVTERGTVVRLADGEAIVRIPRDSQCRNCPGCVVSENGRGMLAQVSDQIGVQIGDEVEISNARMRTVLDGAILLLLPLILFIIFYAVGSAYLSTYVVIPGSLVVAAIPVAYIRGKERRGAYKLQVARVIAHSPGGGLESSPADRGADGLTRRIEHRAPVATESLPEALRIRNSEKNVQEK